MSKLNLSTLADLSQVIGAVAIVVSLIYVGKELNANTAAVQAASLQSITNSSSASMLAIVENGDLAEIRLQGDADPSRLEGADQLRYQLYQRQMWLHFQNVWTQWRLGVIGDDVWNGYRYVICDDMLATPARRQWWRAHHAKAMSVEFVTLVEACSAQS